jgi:type 1 glutamine amidotransferase
VLMVTTTAAFRHDSIPIARRVMETLAASTREFSLAATEDLSALDAGNLRSYDVVMFALTSGELPLTASQKNALVDFVSSGHGFIGVHSATDTLYEWPDYGRLVGAYFRDHPWTQQGSLIVEDAAHPASGGIGDRFSLLEEFYTFQENPRGRVQVLLRLDAASVGATGDYPLAWAHSFGAGRAYYNALGHFSGTWMDARFQRQLAGAIRWTASR